MTRYRSTEKWRFEPPACPECGHRGYATEWIDVHCSGEMPGEYVMPGRIACPVKGCKHSLEAA